MRSWKRWLSILLTPGLLTCTTLMAQTKWHHRYAEVNDVKLHYVEQGKGPLILFLHGFPEFWYAWKNLLPEFAKDHHAVAVDMRGYNLSDKPGAVEQYRVLLIVKAPHPAVSARELAGTPAQQKASAYFNLFNSPQAEKVLSQNDFQNL